MPRHNRPPERRRKPGRCPHPKKAAWDTFEEAEASILQMHTPNGSLYTPAKVYECKPGCGKFHLSRCGPVRRP